MTYSDTILNLSNNILVFFDTVYHSAEIVSPEKERYPAVSLNDEWIKLSPSDQREIIYIRRSGDDEVMEELKLGSCVKSYKMRSSLRIVFFKDHAKNQTEILRNLMQAVLITGTKLKSVIRDKWKLKKDESSGDYNFGPSSAYFAIEIYALWDLIPENCDYDYCVDIENPLNKTSCLAAVRIS